MISIFSSQESGMDFVRSAHDTVFRIESSSLYKNRKQNVKMAEFLLLKQTSEEEEASTLWVVEAKTTVSSKELSTAADINEKLFNALALTLIGISGRCTPQQYKEIPPEFRDIAWGKVKFRFFLIIKNCPERFLSSYSKGLSDFSSQANKDKLPHHAIQSMLGIKNPIISVLNERLARELKIIR